MNDGQIFRTTALTVHSDDGNYRETWRTKKGHRFVILLLETQGLDSMGWKLEKKKKNDSKPTRPSK